MSETVIKKTVKRKTKSKKTPASLRREGIDELERKAMSDEENPRDKLKALELLARLTETNESPFEKPLVVRVEITDDEPEN